MAYSITREDFPLLEDIHAVLANLREYDRGNVGDPSRLPLTLLLRDDNGQVAGGLIGIMHWGWLHVENLAVREEDRGYGYGTLLLQMAEQEAVTWGCCDAYLETFSFQALPFYERRGYLVYATLPDFPRGYSRHFLKKALTTILDGERPRP